jgi:hypothetical protein
MLALSSGTVKSHVAALLRLHGANNRTELVSVTIAAKRSDAAGRTPAGSRCYRPGSGGGAPSAD